MMKTLKASGWWTVNQRTVMSWLGVILVWALLPAPAHADFMVRPVNLAYLTQRADIIVQGRVVETRYEGMPNYPHIPTVLVTLEVERMLRGPEGARFTFRQFLPSAERRTAKNAYLVGQRLLLFLPAPSRFGLSSPIGHAQGRFHILRDASGREMVQNEMGNAGLFKNVTTEAEMSGVGLNQEETQVAGTPRGPIALRQLVPLVEHLRLLPRIQ
ncbi:MAG: hypothetical protein LAO07_07305 [Acidobacteriia bacterium]|nr:hypothetical protein [Terriglobia bacterium]